MHFVQPVKKKLLLLINGNFRKNFRQREFQHHAVQFPKRFFRIFGHCSHCDLVNNRLLLTKTSFNWSLLTVLAAKILVQHTHAHARVEND